ncbi:MAG: hypothetical protein ACRYF3_04245 [Janthinobacterium lividum]
MRDDTKAIEQQMLMQRPWDVAEPQSWWDVTGFYPTGLGRFTNCLAYVVTGHVDLGGHLHPVFALVGGLAGQYVEAAWITHALPLMLVYRDEPHTAYYEDDQDLIARTCTGQEGGSQ